MAGVTLARDYDINRKLAELATRVEYLERRNLALEARGQWQTYAPTLTNIPATVTAARWSRSGNIVAVWAALAVTGAVTGTIEVSVPVNIATPGSLRAAGTSFARPSGATGLNGFRGIVLTRTTGNTISFATTTAAAGNAWAATVPFVWSNGALLTFTTMYEGVPA